MSGWAKPAFPARYRGRCGECDGPINEGDMIHRRSGSWDFFHEVCPEQSDPLSATHPVCQTCWLTHPEGACDR